MWQQHHCSAYAVQLRNTPWVQTILRKMQCPPRPFDLWRAPDPAESSVQSPGFHLKQTPEAKKMPRPKAKVQLKLQPKKKAKAEARPAETSSSSSGAAVPGESVSSSSSAAVSSVQGKSMAKPRGSVALSLADSSAVAVCRVQCDIPWPCTQCKQLPWRCRCHCAGDRTLEPIQQEDELIIQQEYERVCKRAGVWELAEEQQGEADRKAAQPEPPEEHPPRDLWSCSRCWTMNTRHDLVCCVATCGARRPVVHWRGDKGDWICPECKNHNYGRRRWCNWSACPDNDWRCRCGRPRPFNYP